MKRRRGSDAVPAGRAVAARTADTDAVSRDSVGSGCAGAADKPAAVDGLDAFREFARVIDEKNELRERVITTSRELTKMSKKLIFTLQRVTGARNRASVLEQARGERAQLDAVLDKLGELLPDCNVFWQQHRSVSPGLQEYVEAIVLQHYLEHNQLLGFSDAAAATRAVPLPLADYLLGVADVAGEVMRVAVNAIASGALDVPPAVLTFLAPLTAAMLALPDQSLLRGKTSLLTSSLAKVENTVYLLRLRGKEMTPDMLARAVQRDTLTLRSADE